MFCTSAWTGPGRGSVQRHVGPPGETNPGPPSRWAGSECLPVCPPRCITSCRRGGPIRPRRSLASVLTGWLPGRDRAHCATPHLDLVGVVASAQDAPPGAHEPSRTKGAAPRHAECARPWRERGKVSRDVDWECAQCVDVCLVPRPRFAHTSSPIAPELARASFPVLV